MEPCNDPKSETWLNVPDGSTFELRVTGNGNFTSVAQWSEDGGAPVTWNHAEISPGPKTETVRRPHRYQCLVTVNLLEAGPVRVRARVIRPGGIQHGKAYCREISGGPGLIETIDLSIITSL
jgi:hypothetical protein